MKDQLNVVASLLNMGDVEVGQVCSFDCSAAEFYYLLKSLGFIETKPHKLWVLEIGPAELPRTFYLPLDFSINQQDAAVERFNDIIAGVESHFSDWQFLKELCEHPIAPTIGN